MKGTCQGGMTVKLESCMKINEMNYQFIIAMSLLQLEK